MVETRDESCLRGEKEVRSKRAVEGWVPPSCWVREPSCQLSVGLVAIFCSSGEAQQRGGYHGYGTDDDGSVLPGEGAGVSKMALVEQFDIHEQIPRGGTDIAHRQ